MNNINLLPVAVGVKTATVKVVAFLKKVSIIITALFLCLGLAALVYFFIASRQLANIKAGEKNLKTTLSSLEETEQQYVLVKDRVTKVKKIIDEKTVEEKLTGLEKLRALLPAGLTISEVEIKEDKTEVSLVGTSSRDAVSFFASLLVGGVYEKITLKSFGFNPESGFLITLEVS